MKTALLPFMVLAGLGFALSVVANLASIAGIQLPGGGAVFGLHVGLFVVWIPTVLVMTRISQGTISRDLWKVALSGCPRWMRTAVFVVFAYGILNFVLFMASTAGASKPTGDSPPTVIRGFSGHWMVFYSAAFATLYSVRAKGELLSGRRCSSQHPLSLSAEYCETCGERTPAAKSGA